MAPISRVQKRNSFFKRFKCANLSLKRLKYKKYGTQDACRHSHLADTHRGTQPPPGPFWNAEAERPGAGAWAAGPGHTSAEREGQGDAWAAGAAACFAIRWMPRSPGRKCRDRSIVVTTEAEASGWLDWVTHFPLWYIWGHNLYCIWPKYS